MKRITLILKGADELFNPCATNLELDGRDLLNWAAGEYPSNEVVGFEVRDITGERTLTISRNEADEAFLNSLI